MKMKKKRVIATILTFALCFSTMLTASADGSTFVGQVGGKTVQSGSTLGSNYGSGYTVLLSENGTVTVKTYVDFEDGSSKSGNRVAATNTATDRHFSSNGTKAVRVASDHSAEYCGDFDNWVTGKALAGY